MKPLRGVRSGRRDYRMTAAGQRRRDPYRLPGIVTAVITAKSVTTCTGLPAVSKPTQEAYPPSPQPDDIMAIPPGPTSSTRKKV